MKTLIRTLAIVIAFTIFSTTISEAASISKGRGKYKSAIKKARYKRSSKKLKRVDVSKCPGIFVSRNEL